jgi:secreted trypsin-like serine protease
LFYSSSHSTGDSGGPILDDAGVQVGIVSWSKKPCGILGYPGVYARVSAEFDWIKETACELTGTNAQFCKTEISKKSKECKKSKKGMMVQMKKRNGMKSKKGMMTQMKRGME